MKALVESRPDVMMGNVGTRITVEEILGKLGAGETVDELLEAHPRLSREGVQAALGFGAEALRADVVYPTPGKKIGQTPKKVIEACTDVLKRYDAL